MTYMPTSRLFVVSLGAIGLIDVLELADSHHGSVAVPIMMGVASGGALALLLTAFAYHLTGFVDWLLARFDPQARARVYRYLLIAIAFAMATRLVFVVALYFRYDVVASNSYNKNGVEFLVWDRWTGESRVYFQSKEMKSPVLVERDL